MYINIPDSDNVITTQYKHVDRKIEYEILQKVTRGGTQCHCSNIHQGVFVGSLSNNSYGSQIKMYKP
jgi:hypothetical protein